jgi:FKBP-type peptidyl-prolyl cis-trans isomerase SlpA
MAHPQPNDTVSIFFIGKLDNGEVFYEVTEDAPMQFTIGSSDLPPSLEQEIVKLQVGEKVKVRLPPEEGYGARLKDLVQTIDNRQMVDSLNPKPGMLLSLKVEKDGREQKVPATVMAVNGSEITVDYNHPLAGHHLTYEITLLDILNNTTV